MTIEEIDFFCENVHIIRYVHNNDGTIDVNQHVSLPHWVHEVPPIFNVVHGFFECMSSQLTSLIGSPNEVFGGIWLSNCEKLSSLVGLPNNFTSLTINDSVEGSLENFQILMNCVKVDKIHAPREFLRKYNRYKSIVSILK